MVRTALLILALALPPLTPAQAQTGAPPMPPPSPVDGVTLDPPHTSAAFFIRHILAHLDGRFDAVAGSIDIAPANPAKGRVSLTVQAASISTGVPRRDFDLRSPSYFDTAQYPTITFVSDTITPAGKDAYAVTGKLTIKDVAKQVTIPLVSLGKKPHPAMPCVDVQGYEATVQLNPVEFHVIDPKVINMGMLDNTVELRLAGEILGQRPGCVKPAAP